MKPVPIFITVFECQVFVAYQTPLPNCPTFDFVMIKVKTIVFNQLNPVFEEGNCIQISLSAWIC